MDNFEHSASKPEAVATENTPKLSRKEAEILFDCLTLTTTLRDHKVESSSQEVDLRDLAHFIGDRARQYDTLPLDTSVSFLDYQKNLNWSVDLYQATLDINERATPFGRLVIHLQDRHLFTKGEIKINFRRLGQRYVLEIGINKGSFHCRQRFDDSKTPIPEELDQKKTNFGLLDSLGEYLDNDPANDHLVQGLKGILQTISR